MRRFFSLFLFFIILGAGNLEAQSPYWPLAPDSRRTPVVEAIEQASPAVVSVYAEVINSRSGPSFRTGDPFHDEFFDMFFDDPFTPRRRQGLSLGTGVIIDGERALIVTNEHVIRDAGKITVRLNDEKEYPAKVLGAEANFDLAILSIEPKKKLPAVKMGDSENLFIGETVIAIGNPFGLSHSATTGVISAVGRNVPTNGGESLKDLIQTDASINPGNSGGPLVNIKGEMIGINTAILANGEGLGFAIPTHRVKRVVAGLMHEASRQNPLYLGLDFLESASGKKGQGLRIKEVAAKSPAQNAGLLKGDFLLALDEAPTDSISDYEMVLASLLENQEVVAKIKRGSENLSITLRPAQLTEELLLGELWTKYGLAVNQQQGYLILKNPADNSPAAKMGLQEGDLLLALGANEVRDPGGLAAAFARLYLKGYVDLGIQRGRRIYQLRLSGQ